MEKSFFWRLIFFPKNQIKCIIINIQKTDIVDMNQINDVITELSYQENRDIYLGKMNQNINESNLPKRVDPTSLNFFGSNILQKYNRHDNNTDIQLYTKNFWVDDRILTFAHWPHRTYFYKWDYKTRCQDFQDLFLALIKDDEDVLNQFLEKYD